MTTTQTTEETTQRFPLGQVVATPGALAAFERAEQTPSEFLDRHVRGDWGELCADDKAANDAAVDDGGRLMSAYALNDGTRIWIITEGDRSATTALLPEEY